MIDSYHYSKRMGVLVFGCLLPKLNKLLLSLLPDSDNHVQFLYSVLLYLLSVSQHFSKIIDLNRGSFSSDPVTDRCKGTRKEEKTRRIIWYIVCQRQFGNCSGKGALEIWLSLPTCAQLTCMWHFNLDYGKW